MCGIVGAVAKRDVEAILLEGLKRLEYRGYDSAGIAIINEHDHNIHRIRQLGKVASLEKAMTETPLHGFIGIAHTRWATHGEPNQTNAHPHISQNEIAVVHNGIIENHEALRQQLTKDGYHFESETDTEVIVHLLHQQLQNSSDMVTAIFETTKKLKGAYALGIIHRNNSAELYSVRYGSPLVIGVGVGENFLASDPLALAPVTQQFIYLEDGDIAKISLKDVTIFDRTLNPIKRQINSSDVTSSVISKGNFRHFMLKEIYEQSQAITDTIDGHIFDGHVSVSTFGHKAEAVLKKIKRVQIVACGTSYHASLVAQQWIEKFAKMPCRVEIASEFRYRDIVVEPDSLFIALSQSGETADTLAALRIAKSSGFAAAMSICNVPESTLVRETDLVFLTRTGREIGVAATKTFTAQLTALLLLTAVLCRNKNIDCSEITEGLTQLPRLVNQVLELDGTIKKHAKSFLHKQNALFLGRGDLFPIAMEGALKLKEISYIHAEAYPAGELKHGPLALVDKEMSIIVAAPNNRLFEKMESNVQEVHARGGELTIFTDAPEKWQKHNHSTIIKMPSMPAILEPIGYTIPFQLLSYYVAVLKGTDVDQPRNLAKSVTVE